MFRCLLPLLLASAIAAGDARLLWSLPSGGGVDAISDLLVTDKEVLIERDMTVICLDPATGAERWRRKIGGERWPVAQGQSYGEEMSGVLLRAHDGKLVVPMPYQPGQYDRWGLIVLSLADGSVLSEIDFSGQLGPKGYGAAYRGLPFYTWKSSTGSGIYDLDSFRNRFVIPPEEGPGDCLPLADGRLLSIGYGYLRLIDPATWTVRHLPRRSSPGTQSVAILLGDGGFLLGSEGRFGADLSYKGPTPWAVGPWLNTVCRRQGDAIYVRTAADLRRVDPLTLAPRWTLPLRKCGQFAGGIVHCASDGSILAWAEGSTVVLAEAASGKLRMVLPVPGSNEPQAIIHMLDPSLAVAGGRVFVRTGSALSAWSCAPPRPGDVTDRAEPAWRIAACRAAMAKQEWGNALDCLPGLALAVRLRPEARAEAALLFSQLLRSPVPAKMGQRWREMADCEGTVAPELFRADWVARTVHEEVAVSALIEIGDQAALEAAVPWMKAPVKGIGRIIDVAVAAAEQRLGVDKTLAAIIACGPDQEPSVLCLLPLSPERMIAAFPKLTRSSGGDNYLRAIERMPPEVAIAILKGQTEPRAVAIRTAAEAQVASRTTPPKAEPLPGQAPKLTPAPNGDF